MLSSVGDALRFCDGIRTIKPIFHCDAKLLALGTFASPNTKDSTFASPEFFALYPTRNLKVLFYPTRNPNASQWNIGCVGSQRKIWALAIVHFTFFWCQFHSRWVPFSSGIWALYFGTDRAFANSRLEVMTDFLCYNSHQNRFLSIS